jgi:hypothetical protein
MPNLVVGTTIIFEISDIVLTRRCGSTIRTVGSLRYRYSYLVRTVLGTDCSVGNDS